MDSRTCTVRSEAAWPKLKTCMSFVWSKATSEISQSVQVVVSTGDKFDKKREEVLGCVGERGKRQRALRSTRTVGAQGRAPVSQGFCPERTFAFVRLRLNKKRKEVV